MNSERENFEQLRRLLKLKRYEQPPPRYFNDFSSQVIARIRKGERGEASPVGSWFERFLGVFQAKPAYSGAFGAAICAALIGTAVWSEQTTETAVSDGNTIPFGGNQGSPEHAGNIQYAFTGSTNPVPRLPGGSIFDQFQLREPKLAGIQF